MLPPGSKGPKGVRREFIPVSPDWLGARFSSRLQYAVEGIDSLVRPVDTSKPAIDPSYITNARARRLKHPSLAS